MFKMASIFRIVKILSSPLKTLARTEVSSSRPVFPTFPIRTMTYTIQHHGTAYTSDYRVFFKNDQGGIISPFHDIPLFADKENKIYNMVVEIPRWTNAKMEICTTSKMNPIKQDTKKGKMRFVKNVFPYKGYPWNYGAIPQTWEDPHDIDEHTNKKGDGDPIDAIEIGYKVADRGAVIQVKALGVFAMIDDGETDWKVVTIDINDPMAEKLNDINDVHDLMPGFLEATHEWLKIYKMPGGNPPNHFAFDGEAKHKEFAHEVILQNHEQWKNLVEKKVENKSNLACENVTCTNSPYKISQEDADSTCAKLAPRSPCAEIPHDVDTMYFLTEAEKHTAA